MIEQIQRKQKHRLGVSDRDTVASRRPGDNAARTSDSRPSSGAINGIRPTDGDGFNKLVKTNNAAR